MPNTKEIELWRLVNKAIQNSIEKFGDVFAKDVTRDLLDYGAEIPVRCKGCIYYHNELGYGYGQCSKGNLMPYPDDFCSYGERREGE